VCLCVRACRGVEAGVPGKSLLEQCTDCEVRMNMQGSDHAPVHADWDLLAPLPTPETAPPLSTRYMFTGALRCVKLCLGLGSTAVASYRNEKKDKKKKRKRRKYCRLLCQLSLPASKLFLVEGFLDCPLCAVQLPLESL